MKNINLKIDGKVVDINPQKVSIALNKQSVDFNNQNKRLATFSYTIKVPITENNRRIFNYIDNMHVKNRFFKEENYKATLEVNGTILLDGYFILRKITKDSFEGNLVSADAGVILDFGNKTLRDINLPQIPFEGVMIPFKTWAPTYNQTNGNSRYAFKEAQSSCLKKDLCFDFQSLMKGYKDPLLGLYNSTIDYRDYYNTSLVAYTNFPAPVNFFTRVITNNLSINSYMPQIKYLKVLEQMFKDIGWEIKITDPLLNDASLVLPYYGDGSPDWNWKHLSKTKVYQDLSLIGGVTYGSNDPSNPWSNQYIKHPLVASRGMIVPPSSVMTTKSTRSFRTLPDKYNQFTDIVGLYGIGKDVEKVDSTTEHDMVRSHEDSSDIQVHYMATNGLEYDFLNNFSSFNPPGAGQKQGQVYTVPADGEYEFEVEIEHHIRTYTHRYPVATGTSTAINPLLWRQDLWKNSLNGIDGYDGKLYNNTWLYNGQEQFFAANMVAFIKDDFDSGGIASSLMEECTPLPSVTEDTVKHPTMKKIRNWNNENVIAYYHPMLRDLYTGGRNAVWEDYIDREKSILVNPNPIPTGSEIDGLIYMGMGGGETTILNYENYIGYDSVVPDPLYSGYDDNYTREQQYRRKLVRTKKLWGNSSTGLGYVGRSRVREYWTFTNPPYAQGSIVYGNYADGTVKFKFKSKLKAGDQIRMVYITMNQFKMVGQDKYWRTPDFDEDVSDRVTYNDMYVDEYNIKSYSIRSVDENHSLLLKLSNFLPDIKQKDFFDDFLKSNNLYMVFDELNRKVTFKNRGTYLDRRPQDDLTEKMDIRDIEMTPVKVTSRIQYGSKTKDSYDFSGDVDNDVVEKRKEDNIYVDAEKILDLTNKYNNSAINKDYEFRYYPVNWNGGFGINYAGTYYSKYISVPSLQEGGSSNTPNSESDTTYKVGPYILKWDSMVDLFPNAQKVANGNVGWNDVEYLIEGIPFYNLPITKSSTSGGYLDNESRAYQFEDPNFISDDITQVEASFYLTDSDYQRLDLSKAVRIDNALYFIQKIENYNPLNPGLTKMILIKI